jgi:hypothetical protein
MKRILAVALLLGSTFIVAGTSYAQQYGVKATVPFNFMVGDRTLPAGTYTIFPSLIRPDLLLLRNWDAGIHVFTVVQRGQSNPQGLDALVFHHYGDQYFLRQIRTEGTSINVDFPVTKAEKKAWTLVTWTQAQLGKPIVNTPVLIALNQ